MPTVSWVIRERRRSMTSMVHWACTHVNSLVKTMSTHTSCWLVQCSRYLVITCWLIHSVIWIMCWCKMPVFDHSTIFCVTCTLLDSLSVITLHYTAVMYLARVWLWAWYMWMWYHCRKCFGISFLAQMGTCHRSKNGKGYRTVAPVQHNMTYHTTQYHIRLIWVVSKPWPDK